MPLTYEAALAAEHRKVAANIARQERESRRSAGACWGGMGPAHYLPPTEAEIAQAARERVAAYNHPHAVLVRRLIALAAAGVDGACDMLAATDRGSAGCWERAAEFVAQVERRAA